MAKKPPKVPTLADANSEKDVAAYLAWVSDQIASGRIGPNLARELISAAKGVASALSADFRRDEERRLDDKLALAQRLHDAREQERLRKSRDGQAPPFYMFTAAEVAAATKAKKEKTR